MSERPSLFTALVDTSGFYALTDPRDDHHEDGLATQQHLIAQRYRLFTTNFIVAETHALLLNRLGYHVALRALEDIDRSTTRILRVTATDERRAREILVQYDDKAFSLTDATSFVVMERLGIPRAFTFDRNFRQYGFPPLVPSP